MIGLAWYEADRCSGCGGSLSVTTDPGREAKDYLVEKHVCHACEMLSIVQRADEDDKHSSAHLWTVRPF